MAVALLRHGRMDRRRWLQSAGFSLTELMMLVAVTATIMAIAVPAVQNMNDAIKLGQAVRDVERELQGARLRAVSANRQMRVRLNCPVTGQFRMIQVTGVATTDDRSDRCDPTVFLYPSPRDSDRATPDHDGPVRRLEGLVTVGGPNLEFRPDGTTRRLEADNTTTAITTPVTVTITRKGVSREVTINGLGKIELQR